MTQITELPINGNPASNKVLEIQTDSLNGLSEKTTVQNIVDKVPLANYLPLAGGTMTGPIVMGGNQVKTAADPTDAQDLVTKAYGDANYSGAGVAKGNPFVVGDLLEVATDAGDGSIRSTGVQVANLLTAVADDTAPTLGGPLDLNSQPIITRFTAAATFTLGQFGVLNTAAFSGPVISDASAVNTASGAILMALDAINSGQEGPFAIFGYLTGVPGVTAAGDYYLSETPGLITTTRPTTSGAVVRKVGTGNKTNELIFDPDATVITLL